MVQSPLDMALRLGVQRRSRFIKNQHRGVLEQCTGNRQTLPLPAGEQHTVFPNQSLIALGHLLDELVGIGIARGTADVVQRRAGQIAVGDVVGHGIVEQGHLLRHQGDMAAQVAQRVGLDIRTVEQDMAGLMVIETRNQIGQSRLAAAGPTDQRHHLPGLHGEADVVQHWLVAARVDEIEVAHVQTSADRIALQRATVYFRLLVELLEDALGASDTFLNGRTDFRQLANRFGQQPGQRNVGDQITSRRIASQQQHKEHQHCHGAVDHQLQARRVYRIGLDHAQLLSRVLRARRQEAIPLVGLATEATYHAIPLNGFRCHMRHIAHRKLNLLALLAEFLAGTRHHEADHRQDRQHHQGQLPVHPQQRGEEEDHRHALAHHDLDRIGRRAGDHGHVVRDPRDQMAGVVAVKIAIGEGQHVIEQREPQIMHQPQRNLREKKIAEERTDALHERDEDDQQRDGLQQLEFGEPAVLLQVGDLAKETSLGVVQPVDEKLEHVAQHRLGRSKNQKSNKADREQPPVWKHVAQQSQVHSETGLLGRIGHSASPIRLARGTRCGL